MKRRKTHYILQVSAEGAIYRCAINVQTLTSYMVRFIDVHFPLPLLRSQEHYGSLQTVLDLQDGFHPLRSAPDSGALDYFRHPALNQNGSSSLWQIASGSDIARLVATHLQLARRVFVFGEPYDSGLGVHNIHQNQGNDLNTAYGAENGIWQDGALMIETGSMNLELVVLQTGFTTQCLYTYDVDVVHRFDKHMNRKAGDPVDEVCSDE